MSNFIRNSCTTKTATNEATDSTGSDQGPITIAQLHPHEFASRVKPFRFLLLFKKLFLHNRIHQNPGVVLDLFMVWGAHMEGMLPLMEPSPMVRPMAAPMLQVASHGWQVMLCG